jgi:hypothetical protein
VVDAWMPGARCLRAQTDGGTLRGGAPRVVWQALGADPRQVSAGSAAQRLSADGRPPHLVWNPLSGDIVQLIPVVRAACSLGGPEGLDHRVARDPSPGGPGHAPGSVLVPANRQGRLCVQVCVVAWAWEPFTDGPMHGAEALLDWLTSWGVPSRWPAGRPAPFMAARSAERSRAHWSMGGHFGASQVPGWDAAGPGHIEPALLGGLATPACAMPQCERVTGRRPTLTAAPAPLGRARRMALEAVITPDIDSVASVASLANAPY